MKNSAACFMAMIVFSSICLPLASTANASFSNLNESFPTLKASVNKQLDDDSNIKATINNRPKAFTQPAGPGVVGIDFRIHPNQLPYVADVFPGTPAFYAGVMPGDRIVAINGQPTTEMNSQEVDTAISDRPGDTVNLLIDHKGQAINRTVVVMSLALVPSAMIRNQYSVYP